MLIQLKKLQRGYKKKILRGKAFSQAGKNLNFVCNCFFFLKILLERSGLFQSQMQTHS